MSVGSQYYAGAVATGPGLPLEISRTKDATCLGCILTSPEMQHCRTMKPYSHNHIVTETEQAGELRIVSTAREVSDLDGDFVVLRPDDQPQFSFFFFLSGRA